MLRQTQQTNDYFYFVWLLYERARRKPTDPYYKEEDHTGAVQWFQKMITQAQDYFQKNISIYQIERTYLEFVIFLERDEKTKNAYISMNSEDLTENDYHALSKTIKEGVNFKPYFFMA